MCSSKLRNIIISSSSLIRSNQAKIIKNIDQIYAFIVSTFISLGEKAQHHIVGFTPGFLFLRKGYSTCISA